MVDGTSGGFVPPHGRRPASASSPRRWSCHSRPPAAPPSPGRSSTSSPAEWPRSRMSVTREGCTVFGGSIVVIGLGDPYRRSLRSEIAVSIVVVVYSTGETEPEPGPEVANRRFGQQRDHVAPTCCRPASSHGWTHRRQSDPCARCSCSSCCRTSPVHRRHFRACRRDHKHWHRAAHRMGGPAAVAVVPGDISMVLLPAYSRSSRPGTLTRSRDAVPIAGVDSHRETTGHRRHSPCTRSIRSAHRRSTAYSHSWRPCAT